MNEGTIFKVWYKDTSSENTACDVINKITIILKQFGLTIENLGIGGGIGYLFEDFIIVKIEKELKNKN